jgi:type IV pilus assembly protein PilA
MRNRQRGFSLIELLVVVGIILVIAAISIPNYLRARESANESSAAASLRSINVAETSYSALYPTVGFTALVNLGGSASDCANGPSTTNGCFIDNFLASNGNGSGKDGFSFTIQLTGSPAAVYMSDAEPLSPSTGSRAFCSDQSNVIYYLAPNTCTPATGAPM